MRWKPKLVFLSADKFSWPLTEEGKIYTLSSEKETKMFFVISPIKCKWYWGNLVYVSRINLLQNDVNVFTALHVMQTRYCEEISVRLSVRLSVTRVIPDKTEERSVQIFIPYERTFILVFWEEEWLVGGDPFYLKFWVNRPPLEKNRRFSTNNRS